ncbi:MAG: preprotein translocase subunit SecY [Armatimonadetes bacterium]|nr:preprotein translocase subunit SecY [Armatimonadota bacterium]
MLASILAATRIPDLKKRITFLFGMFAVYVIGLHISVPGVDSAVLSSKLSGGLFDLLNSFTGGAFKKYTIFAMGIMPYINASIIMQLLTIAIPQLEELQKEGAAGQKKIRLWTRWLTGVLALFQAYGTTSMLRNMGAVQGSNWQVLQIAITLVAGTAFLMWLGEQISDHGIGNGVSIVIFAGIIASLPPQIMNTVSVEWPGNIIGLALLLIMFVATVAFMIAVTQAQRKIPIQHVKRVVGNKMYGGQSSFLPLKVNSAGVIPIIFAVSIQYFPMTIAPFLSGNNPNHWFYKFANYVSPGNTVVGSLIYAAMIIFFTYFYTAVTFNVKDVSDNLKKWGSFIPGIRPGKPTQDYLDRIMTRITLSGAIFLALVALLQYYVPAITNIQTFSLVGGTSLLIVVGVALETMQAIESHLLMRHYEGFIK